MIAHKLPFRLSHVPFATSARRVRGQPAARVSQWPVDATLGARGDLPLFMERVAPPRPSARKLETTVPLEQMTRRHCQVGVSLSGGPIFSRTGR
ncbi:hypothetical protein EVAR_24417_1 [Eumeta japonica]|uniref:Uncharacterized protein n=1 Tax=Eumeta variegata TaxID=151549 RepID=A0A4C1VQW8_EUMVA|nr:hypothetical protein EVAR_24417_1 [Eumeta japonica]